MRTETMALQQRFFLLPMVVGKRDGSPLYSLFTQNQVVEVLGRRTVYPVPFSPPYLRGIIQRQDRMAPVIDADLLCDRTIQGARRLPRQFLLVRTGQQEPDSGDFLTLAFACSETVLTFKLSEQEASRAVAADSPPPSFAAQELVTGFFRLRGYRVLLFDCNAIVRGVRPGADSADARQKHAAP